MGHRQVVALHEILDQRLPVRAPFLEPGFGAVTLLDPVIGDKGLQTGEVGSQRRRIVSGVHEQEAAPFLESEFRQCAGGGIEPLDLVHIGCLAQRAVQIIAPGMIGAGQHGRLALALDKRHSAMPADIRIGADIALPVTHHHHRLVADLHRHILSGRCDFRGMAGTDPAIGKQARLLLLEHGRIIVIPARHGMRGARVVTSHCGESLDPGTVKQRHDAGQDVCCWSKKDAPFGSSGIGMSNPLERTRPRSSPRTIRPWSLVGTGDGETGMASAAE